MKYKATVLFMILILLTNIAPFIFVANVKTVLASSSPSSLETIEVSRPVQLTTDPSYDRDSCFLEDETGTFWLFFARGRGINPNVDLDFYDIYYLKSTDDGATWTEYSMPSTINDPYGQREIAAYEIPELDLIVVFFTDAFYSPGTPTKGVYYTYTDDYGTSWQSATQVPGITANHIDVLNYMDIRWLFYEGTDTKIYVTYLSGSTWSTPIQISQSGIHGGIPKAMIDDSGDLNVVWCCYEASPVGGIYRSTSSDGITWTPPQQILTSPSGIYACDPVLVQDLSGTYWMFWAPWDSATDSQWLEVVNSTDGTTWSSSRHVTSGGYGGNYWWDMWPEAYVKSSGDMLLFYDSGVAGDGAGGYTQGDGNIWMFKVDWNLLNHHYEFIQEAVDDAPPGETILVHDGTYIESLYINKSLTIKAASKPIIRGSALFATDYGNREAVIFVKDAGNVILEGLDVEGEGLGPGPTRSYGILYQNSRGKVVDCILSPNTISDMYSVGIAGISRSNLLIENCTIMNFGRIGVYATNVVKITIIDNEIIGQIYAQDNLVNYGIEIEDYDGASTADIFRNEIYNCDNTHPSPLWSSAAIIVDIWRAWYDLPLSTVFIEFNDIHDNYEAIEVVSGNLSYAHYNNIYNNRYGVWNWPDLNGNNGTFDARFNWWGHETGPYHNSSWIYMGILTIGPNYGSGDNVGDYVLYDPWLENQWPPTTLPTLRVEPSSYTATSHHETFDINITVSDILEGMGVQAIQFRLQFNSTLLEVADVTEGSFMAQAGDTWLLWIVEDDDPYYGTNTLVGTVLLPQLNTTEGGIYTAFPEGSGTVATITFRAIYQQIGLENPPLSCDLTLTNTLILNVEQQNIEHNTENGYYEILPWPRPTMRVAPENYTAKMLNETFNIDVEVSNLHASLMKPVAVQFRLLFNSTLLEVESVTEGPLIREAGPTYFIYFVEYDDLIFGSNVIVGILLLPENETGQYNYYANGTGTVATVTLKSVYQHVGLENPPITCNLTLAQTLILDENMENISYTIENWATYAILPNNIADINWDYVVDMKDIGIAARAFGSEPGHPRWNPICDINGDGKVDMRDIAVVAREFGWTPDP